MFIEIGAEQKKMLAERAKADAPNKTGGGVGGKKIPIEFVKILPDTEVFVRLLPPWTTEGIYSYSPHIRINQHWNVGPNNKVVICPQHTPHSEHKECFVCEQCKALFGTGDKVDEDRARRMYAGKNFIYQVIERGDEFWADGEERIAEHPELAGKPKVKFMRLPYTAHKLIVDIVADPDWGDITSPSDGGRDIKVARTGSGINTQYGIVARPNKTPLFSDPELISATAALMNNLEEHPFFRAPSYDDTRALYMGEEVKKSGELGAGSSGSGYGSQKSLTEGVGGYGSPDTTQYTQYDDWKTAVSRGEALDNAGLSAKMDWPVAKIPPCYGNNPNHRDKDCWECPVKKHCAPQFALTHNGDLSEAAPKSAPPTGKGSSPSFGRSTPPPPQDDDIPF